MLRNFYVLRKILLHFRRFEKHDIRKKNISQNKELLLQYFIFSL